MSTIHQVDPIALRQKLKKLGIGPGLPMSQTFAEDAVRDCLNRHAGEASIVSQGTEINATVTGDVDCKCPKCGHEWELEGITLEDDSIEVDGDECAEARELDVAEQRMAPGPDSLVLEPAELAYCLFNWSQLWEVPA